MTGCLVAVVGPSGVGKDSVIAGLVAARPDLTWVRRAITRPPSGTEPFEALSDAQFDARAAAGGFCLSWGAHGLRYGVPASALSAVQDGGLMVANLSRGQLARAAQIFPALRVLSLSARPETLAARLAGRGRETAADIAARLSRRAPLPEGLDVVEIANDGPLAATVDQALSALPALAPAPPTSVPVRG
ncbi:MAG: phosphonate metabolism protein/1,5-bisphosphokinase (PRPP-forming) PhnN [Paracoccaceae bacterium]